MRPYPEPPAVPLPALSDEAAVEILDFLQDVLTIFESHYGTQIRRYYEDHSRHNIIQFDLNLPTKDPPF
jgi:hypothetical protein